MVLNSSAVDHEFEPRTGQTNDYKIGICCYSTIIETLEIWNYSRQVNNTESSYTY